MRRRVALQVDIVWQSNPMPWLTAAHAYMPCAEAPDIWKGHRPNEKNLQEYGHKWQCPVAEGAAAPKMLDLMLMEDGRTDSSGPVT